MTHPNPITPIAPLGRVGARTILHVDMDAFYVAVEVLQDPTLAGKAVIVGGEGARGVVASCSYEARAYGVRSAMSSVRARRLCPHAVFVRGNHALYGQYSERIHEIFNAFTPIVEGIALDEAFLDLTGSLRLFGTGPTAAVALRIRVLEDLGLSCSVGIAPSKLLAKLASEAAKPAIGAAAHDTPTAIAGARRVGVGVVEVVSGDEVAFLHPHPVRALWGVGPKTFERLARFGVETVGDLARLPEATVTSALGPSAGRHLHTLAAAIDDRPVEPERAVKSIGHEETFAVDHHDLEPLEREVLRLADAVAGRARAAGVRGRTVQLKIKLADFRLLTRSRTLPEPADIADMIASTARSLLREAEMRTVIESCGARLLGVSISNLVEGQAEQLHLFGENRDRRRDGTAAAEEPTIRAVDPLGQRRLTEAVDAIRLRFGTAAVGPAALTKGGRVRVKQAGDTQWGPNQDHLQA